MKTRKEKNLKFIQDFSKISISDICKKYNISRAGLYTGEIIEEKTEIVREEIENKIGRLFMKEDDINAESSK